MITLHIPSNLYAPVTEAGLEIDQKNHAPLFKHTNGGGESVAIYRDYNSPSIADNHRATVMAQAISPNGVPDTLKGDAYFVCPEDMAQAVLANDENFQSRVEIRDAFVKWANAYAEEIGKTPGHVAAVVDEFISDLVQEANDRQQEEFVNHLAANLGIKPEEIGVIRL